MPDGFVGSVLREMRPALRQQRYGEAMMAAAETIGATIAKSKNVTLTAQLPRRIRPDTNDSIPWPVIIGGVFLLIWLSRRGGPRGYGGGGGGGFLPGMILGRCDVAEFLGRARDRAVLAGPIRAAGSAASAAAIREAAGASSDW